MVGSVVTTKIRFTFARPDPDPMEQSNAIQAALEMVRWADAKGVSCVRIDEHHATDFGWSANPIMEGGCFLAATSHIEVSVPILAPLWNPIRLAEDIAWVDQLSRGRLSVTVALGYRPLEYLALGVDFHRRGELADELLETVLKAWSGERFERNGAEIRVTPVPFTKPHPPLAVGGAAKATARRAVRFRLPLDIPRQAPDLKEYYEQLCSVAGLEPNVRMASLDNLPATFLHEDPDRAWGELGKHFAWEATTYGQWTTADMGSIMHVAGLEGVDEVRASGRYVIMTPDDLVDHLAAHGAESEVTLHPLCGGMPVEEAWKSVHLLTDDVIPKLRARGIAK